MMCMYWRADQTLECYKLLMADIGMNIDELARSMLTIKFLIPITLSRQGPRRKAQCFICDAMCNQPLYLLAVSQQQHVISINVKPVICYLTQNNLNRSYCAAQLHYHILDCINLHIIIHYTTSFAKSIIPFTFSNQSVNAVHVNQFKAVMQFALLKCISVNTLVYRKTSVWIPSQNSYLLCQLELKKTILTIMTCLYNYQHSP